MSQRIAAAAQTFLPPSFEIIPRLLLILDDPEVDGEELAELIRIDAGLSANILRVANSGLYSRGSRVETLVEAINRLGLQEIHRTVMNIVAAPVLGQSGQNGFARLDLWKHSLTAAVGAQILASHLHTVEPDVAFTAGLLHDVGKLVLSHAIGSGYVVLIEEAKASTTALVSAERAAYKTDHAEVGARLLKNWNFPDRITASIAFHHAPESAPPAHAIIAAVVCAANILAYRVGSGYGFPLYAANPSVSALKPIGLTPPELFAYEQDVREALEQEQRRFEALNSA